MSRPISNIISADEDRDRAKYDASSSAYVVYTVANPTDAPANLTFGPSFMSLAATYPGTVVVGESLRTIKRTVADDRRTQSWKR